MKGKANIGEGFNIALSKLAEANGLKGVIDAVDFNDEDKLGKGKEMQDRLSNLIGIFENPELDFSKNKADGDDLLGDAYEYLTKHFAVDSGKSKGQFSVILKGKAKLVLQVRPGSTVTKKEEVLLNWYR